MSAAWSWTACPTPLGPFTAVFRGRLVGGCALGRLPAAFLAGLAPPLAAAQRDDEGGAFLRRQVREYFAGRRRRFRLRRAEFPASPLRRRLWQALARLPFGQTLTYAGLARRAGRPRAARAAGAACAANPFPLLVPCHRVVAAGGPGGYGPGPWRKRWLLAHEGAPGFAAALSAGGRRRPARRGRPARRARRGKGS